MKAIICFSSNSQLLQLVVLIILFILVLLGAFFVTKIFGERFKISRGSKRNINIVESINIGPSKYIQLIKIGQEYVLIGVTKDTIVFLKNIEKNNLDLHDFLNKNTDVAPFTKQLQKIMNRNK